MQSLKTLLKESAKNLKPPSILNYREWADAEAYLSKEDSAEPGKWRTSRIPYLKEILETLSTCRRAVLMFAAQTGKTAILKIVTGYHIDQDPCPIMIVQPTLGMAEKVSKKRILPMIRDTPALANKLEIKSRTSDNTILEKVFSNGASLTLVGANSPASLASESVKVLLLDEVDRYVSANRDGDAADQGEMRTETYWDSLIIFASSPTIEGDSRIESEFELTDKRYLHVPCPHCHKKQVLKFKNLKWENNDSATAHFICIHCSGKMKESDKAWMIDNCEWIPTAKSSTPGWHLPGFYRVFKPWSNIVRKWLLALKDPRKLRVFINTELAETFQERGDAPEWERLHLRCENYQFNFVNKKILFLTCGVDVQKNRIELEIIGWGRDKENWSVDYRIIEGNTDTIEGEPYKKLDALLNETFITENKLEYRIIGLAIDTGYNSQIVYQWGRKYPSSRVFLIKGNSRLRYPVSKPSMIDVTIAGKKIKKGAQLINVGVDILKSEFYGWLRLDKNQDGSFPAGYCHFPEYSESHFKELTSEEIFKGSFRKIREKNEALDCRIYGRAAAAILGMDRFTDKSWDKLEKDAENPLKTSAQLIQRPRRVISRGIQI